MKKLVSEHEEEDSRRKKDLEQIKNYIQEHTKAVELMSGAEEAMRFLYACLDDIEVDGVDGTQKQAAPCATDSNAHPTEFPCSLDQSTVDGTQKQAAPFCATDSNAHLENPTEFSCSLDQLTAVQRQKLLMNLLRTAVSIRAVAQNPAVQKPSDDVFSLVKCGSLHAEKGVVSVEDILSLPMDELECGAATMRKVVSSGVQTEALNLEERLALEIKERLRPCSSLGTAV